MKHRQDYNANSLIVAQSISHLKYGVSSCSAFTPPLYNYLINKRFRRLFCITESKVVPYCHIIPPIAKTVPPCAQSAEFHLLYCQTSKHLKYESL